MFILGGYIKNKNVINFGIYEYKSIKLRIINLKLVLFLVSIHITYRI